MSADSSDAAYLRALALTFGISAGLFLAALILRRAEKRPPIGARAAG